MGREYQPLEIGELCIKHLQAKDPRMNVYGIFGAWVGYYGNGVAIRVPTNRDGGLTDPQFVRQMVEGNGMGMILNLTDPRMGLNADGFGNYLNPLGLLDGSNGKNPLDEFQEMSDAYRKGKRYGEQLRSQNPPDGSVKGIDMSMLDFLEGDGTTEMNMQ